MQKSGVKFEASIRKREASNPRFGFLLPGHPFHSYYRQASKPPRYSFALRDTPHQACHSSRQPAANGAPRYLLPPEGAALKKV